MSHKTTLNIVIIILTVMLLTLLPHNTHARMLPTRSNEDQLDKLRELLRDILETDSEYRPKLANSLVEKRADDKEIDDYKTLKDYTFPRSSLFPAASLLNDKDLKYLSYKKGLPLRFYGLMKNNGDD